MFKSIDDNLLCMGGQPLYREASVHYRTEPHEIFVTVSSSGQATVTEGPRHHLKLPVGSRAYIVDTRPRKLDVQTSALTLDNHFLDDVLCAYHYGVGSPDVMIRNLPDWYESHLSREITSRTRLEVLKIPLQEIIGAKAQLEEAVLSHVDGYARQLGLKSNALVFERIERPGDYAHAGALADLQRRNILAIAEEQCRARLGYARLASEVEALEGLGIRKAAAQAQVHMQGAMADAKVECYTFDRRMNTISRTLPGIDEKTTPENLPDVIRELGRAARSDDVLIQQARQPWLQQFPPWFQAQAAGVIVNHHHFLDNLPRWNSPEELDRILNERLFGH